MFNQRYLVYCFCYRSISKISK